VAAIASPEAVGVGPTATSTSPRAGSEPASASGRRWAGYLRSFASGGSGPGQVGDVAAIDFSSSGEVLVSDPGNERIGRFGPGGNWIGELPIESQGLGGIGANLYVALGDRVAILTPPATVNFFGGSTDTSDGVFGLTSDLATSADSVYVADSRLSRILAFDPSGGLKGTIGQSPGIQPGQLTEPSAGRTPWSRRSSVGSA
jgi:hypothetical protein